MNVKVIFLQMSLFAFSASLLHADAVDLATIPAEFHNEIILEAFKLPDARSVLESVNELKNVSTNNKKIVENFIARNGEKVAQALSNSTHNIFKSLFFLLENNLISQADFDKQMATLKTKYPNEYTRYSTSTLIKMNTDFVNAADMTYPDIVDMSRLKKYIDQGVDVNFINERGYNALKWVTKRRNKAAIKLLLDQPQIDLNKNTTSDSLSSPIMYASNFAILDIYLDFIIHTMKKRASNLRPTFEQLVAVLKDLASQREIPDEQDIHKIIRAFKTFGKNSIVAVEFLKKLYSNVNYPYAKEVVQKLQNKLPLIKKEFPEDVKTADLKEADAWLKIPGSIQAAIK